MMRPLTVIVMDAVVAAGDTPLDAVTVNVLEPAAEGVPLRRPAAVRVRPAGSEPLATLNVGAGEPEAAN